MSAHGKRVTVRTLLTGGKVEQNPAGTGREKSGRSVARQPVGEERRAQGGDAERSETAGIKREEV